MGKNILSFLVASSLLTYQNIYFCLMMLVRLILKLIQAMLFLLYLKTFEAIDANIFDPVISFDIICAFDNFKSIPLF